MSGSRGGPQHVAAGPVNSPCPARTRPVPGILASIGYHLTVIEQAVARRCSRIRAGGTGLYRSARHGCCGPPRTRHRALVARRSGQHQQRQPHRRACVTPFGGAGPRGSPVEVGEHRAARRGGQAQSQRLGHRQQLRGERTGHLPRGGAAGEQLAASHRPAPTSAAAAHALLPRSPVGPARIRAARRQAGSSGSGDGAAASGPRPAPFPPGAGGPKVRTVCPVLGRGGAVVHRVRPRFHDWKCARLGQPAWVPGEDPHRPCTRPASRAAPSGRLSSGTVTRAASSSATSWSCWAGLGASCGSARPHVTPQSARGASAPEPSRPPRRRRDSASSASSSQGHTLRARSPAAARVSVTSCRLARAVLMSSAFGPVICEFRVRDARPRARRTTRRLPPLGRKFGGGRRCWRQPCSRTGPARSLRPAGGPGRQGAPRPARLTGGGQAAMPSITKEAPSSCG